MSCDLEPMQTCPSSCAAARRPPTVCSVPETSETPGLPVYLAEVEVDTPFVAACPTFLKKDSKTVSVSALDVLPLCIFR